MHFDSVLIKTIDYDRKLSMKQLKFQNKIVAIFNVCNHGNKLKENIFLLYRALVDWCVIENFMLWRKIQFLAWEDTSESTSEGLSQDVFKFSRT